MELDYKSVIQFSNNEIFLIIKDKMDSIYNSILYTGMKKDTFEEIVLIEIENIKSIKQFNLDYEKLLIKNVKNRIFQYISELINDNNKAFDIINNYINYNFFYVTYDTSVIYFNKLDTYFEKINYIPNPDIILELINKNNIFKQMITEILNKNENKPIADVLKKFDNNSLQYLSIETYCMLNDIEIEDSKEEIKSFNEYFSEDLFNQYISEISKIPLLTIEEEKKLIIKMKDGDKQAREKLISSNLRLVVNLAHSYLGRGLDFLDLIQEGNIGLMVAADKFDIDKGCRFSTYATWWVRSKMQRAVSDKGNTIRLPVHIYNKIPSYNRTITMLEEKLNRMPTLEEISKESNIPIKQVSTIYNIYKSIISLNTLIGDKDDDELEIFIPSSDKPIQDIIDDKYMKEYIESIIDKKLNERDAKIIKCRLGFYNDSIMTLSEIGDMFDLTRERIRQIEIKAFRIIKMQLKIDSKDFSKSSYKKDESKFSKKDFSKDILQKNKKHEEIEKMKKAKTIYDFFSEYTKEQIDAAIEKLNEKDKNLFIARYGTDLNVPPTLKITQAQKNKLYSSIIPRLKKFLENPNMEIKTRNHTNRRTKTVYEFFNQYTKEQVDEMLKKLDEEDTELVEIYFEKDSNNSSQINLTQEQRNKIYGTLLPKMEKMLKNPNYVYVKRKKKKTNAEHSSDKQNNTIKEESLLITEDEKNNLLNKEECIKILELLKSPTFNQMLEKLSVKEAIIISLRLGYVDNKYFSVESIANFLGIDAEEVNEIAKKVLLLYRDNINNFIDTAIEVVTNDTNKVFTFKNTNIK